MIHLEEQTGKKYYNKSEGSIASEVYTAEENARLWTLITDEEAETLGKEEEPETGSDIE